MVYHVAAPGCRSLDIERKRKTIILLGLENKHGLHSGPNLGIRMAIHKINIEKIFLINVYDINDINRHSF